MEDILIIDGMKAVKAYKLFRIKHDTLYPLYVCANKSLHLNQWLTAEIGGGTGVPNQVKSRGLGGHVKLRPGWHASSVPVATHIGMRHDGSLYRRSDEVWAEVFVSAEKDYQPLADKNGVNKYGRLIRKNADLDYIPVGGLYHYKTNPNMSGDWIIAGAIYINRVLTDEEVASINRLASIRDGITYSDLPRL